MVTAKAHVYEMWSKMSRGATAASHAFRVRVDADAVWHGFHPFRHIEGAHDIWREVWHPFFQAMPDLARRPYVLLSGTFEGGTWVAGTGDLVGTFVGSWLGVPPTGTTVRLRFGEFHRLIDDRIVETRCLVDLPDLFRQAGRPVVPAYPGRDVWAPGPAAGDGVDLEPRDPEASAATLAIVEEMIFGGLNKYDGDQRSQGLERFWSPDMAWHGPVGVGSALGMDEFFANAQGRSSPPFRIAAASAIRRVLPKVSSPRRPAGRRLPERTPIPSSTGLRPGPRWAGTSWTSGDATVGC